LGAYDPIRHAVVTLTHDTVVNQATFCGLLDKIASGYAAMGCPLRWCWTMPAYSTPFGHPFHADSAT
jgi:hypothetical protein